MGGLLILSGEVGFEEGNSLDGAEVRLDCCCGLLGIPPIGDAGVDRFVGW